MKVDHNTNAAFTKPTQRPASQLSTRSIPSGFAPIEKPVLTSGTTTLTDSGRTILPVGQGFGLWAKTEGTGEELAFAATYGLDEYNEIIADPEGVRESHKEDYQRYLDKLSEVINRIEELDTQRAWIVSGNLSGITITSDPSWGGRNQNETQEEADRTWELMSRDFNAMDSLKADIYDYHGLFELGSTYAFADATAQMPQQTGMDRALALDTGNFEVYWRTIRRSAFYGHGIKAESFDESRSRSGDGMMWDWIGVDGRRILDPNQPMIASPATSQEIDLDPAGFTLPPVIAKAKLEPVGGGDSNALKPKIPASYDKAQERTVNYQATADTRTNNLYTKV